MSFKRFSRNLIWFSVSVVFMMMHFSAGADSRQAFPEKLTIAVATDLHYISPDLTDNGPYFQKMTERGDGKAMLSCESVTEAFFGQIITQKPDVLILSGDLTFNGAYLSHAALCEKLARVEEAGISVLVLPGNHDLENTMAAKFSGDGYEFVRSVDPSEFKTLYESFGPGDAVSNDSASLSYVAKVGMGLRVLMLDVNTAPAPGILKEETLKWVTDELKKAHEDGDRVLAVSHQNVLQHNSLFSNGFVMGNNAELLNVYESNEVICNLSGHIHAQHIAQSENGFSEIVTSSLMVSPNQYGLLTLEGTEAEYHTVHVVTASDTKRFMWETAYRQAVSELGESKEAQRMSAFFADINTAYFAGRTDTIEPDEAAASAWQRIPGFRSAYIGSILAEEAHNHTEYSFTFE